MSRPEPWSRSILCRVNTVPIRTRSTRTANPGGYSRTFVMSATARQGAPLATQRGAGLVARGSRRGIPRDSGMDSVRGQRRFGPMYRPHVQTGAGHLRERLRFLLTSNTLTGYGGAIRAFAISWIYQPLAVLPRYPNRGLRREPTPSRIGHPHPEPGRTHLGQAVRKTRRTTSWLRSILGISPSSLPIWQLDLI